MGIHERESTADHSIRLWVETGVNIFYFCFGGVKTNLQDGRRRNEMREVPALRI